MVHWKASPIGYPSCYESVIAFLTEKASHHGVLWIICSQLRYVRSHRRDWKRNNTWITVGTMCLDFSSFSFLFDPVYICFFFFLSFAKHNNAKLSFLAFFLSFHWPPNFPFSFIVDKKQSERMKVRQNDSFRKNTS